MALVRKAGLASEDAYAIGVDAYGRTAVPDVYAAEVPVCLWQRSVDGPPKVASAALEMDDAKGGVVGDSGAIL